MKNSEDVLFSVYVSCPRGLEYLLEDEVKSLGLDVTKITPNGVYGKSSLTVLYTLCLWSRLANRVHLILYSGDAHTVEDIYRLSYEFAWQKVFQADKTIAVEFHGTSAIIRNSMFGGQIIKDAIVDYFRDKFGTRPMVDPKQPQIFIHAYLSKGRVEVSLDLAGYSLHQRGYRLESGKAPLKENVAAAMLMRANWPSLVASGCGLYDPFCGSGTIVIEAAMMALNIAPGLLRNDQLFVNWLQHDVSIWSRLRDDAQKNIRKNNRLLRKLDAESDLGGETEHRAEVYTQVHEDSSTVLTKQISSAVEFPKKSIIKLYGSDRSHKAIISAKENAERAQVSEWITWSVHDLESSVVEKISDKGLMICNPPYGERLDDEEKLLRLYKQIGIVLHKNFINWHAAIITSNATLARAIGLKSDKQYTIYNGALKCKLYCFQVTNENELRSGEYVYRPEKNAEMFANRLRKNLLHLSKWAKRSAISCYRVYDADLPEYAFAIDIYNNYAVLQEYVAPISIPAAIAEKRSQDVIYLTREVLQIPKNNIIVKQRRRQKGESQYKKLATDNEYLIVSEGDAKLKVNLVDYLDTGLFLDHRLLRLKFAKLNSGAKFLNCFCYTGVASVHAALAGAITTNIDLSNTYLNWAQDNFKLNNIKLAKHKFVQANCLEWLDLSKEKFDVIFLDPPSFSNSKRMSTTLDIQRDHEMLINSAMSLLVSDGKLYFSTNLRQFKLSSNISQKYSVTNINKKTIDLDFRRNPKIHHCYQLSGK